MRRNGRGIYYDQMQYGMSEGDFVIYLDHRGQFRIDYILSPEGHHVTIGSTRGVATLKDATRLAAEESHQRGNHHADVYISGRDDYTQIGNVMNGRYQESG